MTDLVGGVAKDGEQPIGDSVAVYEGRAVEAVVPGPGDGEVGVGLFDVDRIRIAIARQSNRQLLGRIQQPGIAVSVENNANGPTRTKRPSWRAARRWM